MNNLKKLRIERNLTLRDLADKVNINYTALSRVENGNRNLNDNDIEILSKFFGVSADYLLGISEVRILKPTSSAKEQLQGVQLAFYNQAEEITEEQACEVLNFIEFIKSRDAGK